MFEVYGLTGMKVDKANLKKKEGGDEAAGEDGGDIDIARTVTNNLSILSPCKIKPVYEPPMRPEAIFSDDEEGIQAQ